jgi:hypothetical protein
VPAPARATAAADYLAVAQNTLFAKDRNPTVVIEVPPPPKPEPEPPLPELPTYFGQMAIGEPVVFLSLKNEQKSYRAGDEVGEFRLVAFDRETITLEWKGKQVERKVTELVPKVTAPPQQAASRPPAAAASAPAAVTSLGSLAAPSAKPEASRFGNDMGGGFRGCLAGDTTPAGTIVNGYRKVVAQGPMGSSCHWEQMK